MSLNAGMSVSYYHFSRYSNDATAQAEANLFVTTAKKMNVPNGTVLFDDFESNWAPASSQLIFYNTIKNSGYTPGIYSSKDFYDRGIISSELMSKKPVKWIAAYTLRNGAVSYGPNMNYFPSGPNISGWQFTDNYLGMNVDATIIFNDSFTGKPVDNTNSNNATNSNSAFNATYTQARGWYTTNNRANVYNNLDSSTYSAYYEKGQAFYYDYKVSYKGKLYLSYINYRGTRSFVLVNSDNTQQPYIVKSGDTLSGIASALGVRLSELLSYNNISNANYIVPGQKIYVSRTTANTTHIVAYGETLSGIANKYNTTIQSIVNKNNIKNVNFIYVGESLSI